MSTCQHDGNTLVADDGAERCPSCGNAWPIVGCLIDGWYGQYATARVVMIAAECGWNDSEPYDGRGVDIARRHLATMGHGDAEPITDGECAMLPDIADDAEEWLNEHVAAPDHMFGWFDGEFFYNTTEWFTNAL